MAPVRDEAHTVAALIETVLRMALAPVVARLRALETADVERGALRERLATLEARRLDARLTRAMATVGRAFEEQLVTFATAVHADGFESAAELTGTAVPPAGPAPVEAPA